MPISQNLFALVSLSFSLLNFRIFHCNFKLCVMRHFFLLFLHFAALTVCFNVSDSFGGGGKGGVDIAAF